MQTPGLLTLSSLAPGAIELAVAYAQMAEQIAAMGTAQDCQKKVEEFERAGASYVVLYPTAIDGDYDKGVRAVLEAFAG
jgi:alkanesulfonate monooxygenase SsuD/methylene tetrahydromethanopterin reductase-like flavin-dependent oxidoreductase (luciferase family)